MHKLRRVGKKGEEGKYGAISTPKSHLSFINLVRTLPNRTTGGKRYKWPDQGWEKASIKEAEGSGSSEE